MGSEMCIRDSCISLLDVSVWPLLAVVDTVVDMEAEKIFISAPHNKEVVDALVLKWRGHLL